MATPTEACAALCAVSPCATGEVRVRALRSSETELHGSEDAVLEPLGVDLVEALVGLAQAGERVPELVDRFGEGVEQLLARIRGGVGHAAESRAAALAHPPIE